MDINQETTEKKLLLDKIIKLIPKNEINNVMNKFRNEIYSRNSSIPSNENEEEKNHSDDPNKLISNNPSENIILESETQENYIKEENLDKKIFVQKPEPKEKIFPQK